MPAGGGGGGVEINWSRKVTAVCKGWLVLTASCWSGALYARSPYSWIAADIPTM